MKGYIYTISILLFVMTISSLATYYVSTGSRVNSIYTQAGQMGLMAGTEDDVAFDLQQVLGHGLLVKREGDTLIVIFNDSTPFQQSARNSNYYAPYVNFINGAYSLQKQANVTLTFPADTSDCIYVLTNGTAEMCYIHDSGGSHDYTQFYTTGDLSRTKIIFNVTCVGSASQIQPPNVAGSLVTVNYNDDSNSQSDTFGIKSSGNTQYQVKFTGSNKVQIQFVPNQNYLGSDDDLVTVDAITNNQCNYTQEFDFSYGSTQQMQSFYGINFAYSQGNVSKSGLLYYEQT